MIVLILLKAIADKTRLEMLHMLLENSCSVGALAERLGLTEATISGHLKILREAGLLTGEKQGNYTYHTVNRDRLRELAGALKALADIRESPEQGIGRDVNRNANNKRSNGRL